MKSRNTVGWKALYWLVVIGAVSGLSCEQERNSQKDSNNQINQINQNKEKPIKQADSAAYRALLEDAQTALELEAFSVLDNNPVPPSGDKHDYYSWSSYYWPNPDTEDGLPYVYKDGKVYPKTEMKSDKPLLRRMVTAVQTLTLAHQYTQEAKYADKARSFLNTWFLDSTTKMNPNLTFAQCVPGEQKGNAYGIIDARWMILLVKSILQLKEDSVFRAGEYKALQSWFNTYLDCLLHSEMGKECARHQNNIGSWYAAQVASLALFVSDRAKAAKMLEDKKRLFQIQIDSMGRVVHELKRSKSFDYSLYSLNSLFSLAYVNASLPSKHQVDLSSEKKRLKKGLEYCAHFILTGEEWPYPQIAKKAIALEYGDGRTFSVYYPYDFYYTMLKAYHLFKEEQFLSAMKAVPMEQRSAHRANLLFNRQQ